MQETYEDFANDVLNLAHLPNTTANVDCLVAVMVMEGSHAAYNPMDTTQPYQGATDYNPTGVRNYPSWKAGVTATVLTLKNGYYTDIVNALSAGNGELASTLWDSSPWGTQNVASAYPEASSHYSTLVSTGASVPTPTPAPEPPPTPTPEPTPTPAPEPTPTKDAATVDITNLQENSKGDSVKSVQLLLNGKANAGLAIDGIFGPLTKNAVVNWQRFFGLTVDGIVGPQTASSLWNQ